MAGCFDVYVFEYLLAVLKAISCHSSAKLFYRAPSLGQGQAQLIF